MTVENWEMKRNIMIKKKNLERGIYIDLTKREREIQGRLRRMAKEKKEKKERKRK